jgi:hypothetical protein
MVFLCGFVLMFLQLATSSRHSPRLVMPISPRENDTFTHGAMLICLVVNGPKEIFLLLVMMIL